MTSSFGQRAVWVRLGRGLLFAHLLVLSTIKVDAQQVLSAVEKKKIHDRQFSGIGGAIDRQLSGTAGDIVFDAYEPGHGEDSNRPLDEILDLYACNANAIIVGIPKSSRSEETATGSTVYTTWTTQVEDLLKIPATKQIPWRSTVDVLANGGSITRPGLRKVTVRSVELPEGLDSSHRYLMFLRLIPETGVFRLYAVFTVDGEFPKSHPAGRHPQVEKVRSGELLAAARHTAIETLAPSNCARVSAPPRLRVDPS